MEPTSELSSYPHLFECLGRPKVLEMAGINKYTKPQVLRCLSSASAWRPRIAMYHIMYLVAASHFSDFKLGSFHVTGTCTCKSTTQRELVNED